MLNAINLHQYTRVQSGTLGRNNAPINISPVPFRNSQVPLLNENKSKKQILRFRKSERAMHWAIAAPFLICYITSLVLVVIYNPAPDRPYRDLFSVIHRCSALALTSFPFLAAIMCGRDYKAHFSNVKQAWLWTISDIKWIFFMGLAKVSKKIELPEQGKFNAAEKMNFMYLMGTYPIYIITGISIWLKIIGFNHWVVDFSYTAWMLHFGIALGATPFIIGHIYMAVANPSTRTGLPGMVSGFVDREWAKHHYTCWFYENFEYTRKSKKEKRLIDLKILKEKESKEQLQKEFQREKGLLASSKTKKNFEEAFKKYDFKKNTLTDMCNLHFLLGQIYEEEGRIELAIKQYETIINDFKQTKKKSEELEKAIQRLAELKK